MNILIAASECEPFIKVGGLGDVVLSLAKALHSLGHDVRIVLPKYSTINFVSKCQTINGPLFVNMGYGLEFAQVLETKYCNIPIYFIEFNKYFYRDGIYGENGASYHDNWQRFAFFNRAVIDLCEHIHFSPDVIHANDWPTGLLPALMTINNIPSTVQKSSTVFTIHNMAHHGYAPKELLNFVGLPDHYFHPFAMEACGGINVLKGAIQFADKITTVSPTYAEEIKSSEQGYGLDDVLRYRAADLCGILNGIDLTTWDPETDKMIAKNFSKKAISGKAICKQSLQQELGLKIDNNIPVFGVISRFFEQKGLDVLCNILPDILRDMSVEFAILGSGDPALEQHFQWIAQSFPGQMSVYIGYNAVLSHRIEAGSDFFVMPSRYEPCGLNQIYSMRYGTLPIAHAVGGLADTIINYDENSKSGTGFLFHDLTSSALYNTIGWACSTFYNKKHDISLMQQQAMNKDFSWSKSAIEYENIYKAAINIKILKQDNSQS